MQIRMLEGFLLAGALALAAPRAARACGRGNSYSGLQALAVGVVVVGGTDVMMTLWDSATVLGVARPSGGYGAFETALAVPQLMIGIAGLTSGTNSGFWGGYTIWMAALTAHGIWSISAARAAAAAPTPAPDPADGEGRETPSPDPPGLQLSIGPTFAPVGQFSYPGFGLIGRF